MASKQRTWVLIQTCIVTLAFWWSAREDNFHSDRLLPGSSLDSRKLRIDSEGQTPP